MGVKVTNNAYGTLSASISTSDTTVTLDSGQGARFPTLGAGDYFYGTLVDTSNNIEVVKVTARSTDSMTVTRGADNTTATAFAIGDRFELRPTAALFEDTAQVINDTTPQLGGDLDTNGNDINFGDGDKAQFGAGNDLQIYHDTTNNHSFIDETGTGDFRIRGDNLSLRSTSTDEPYINAQTNGAVTLYYDNSAKLATTNDGVDVTGTLSNGSGTKYQPVYSGTVTTSDNDYKLFARCSGGSGFDSSCEFSLSGTTGNTVSGCVGMALANHSQDGSITTFVRSNYTGIKIKMVSDGNKSFDLYVAVATYSTNNITMTYRLRAINGTVTPAPSSASYSTCHLIHTAGQNTNTNTGSMSSGAGSTSY